MRGKKNKIKEIQGKRRRGEKSGVKAVNKEKQRANESRCRTRREVKDGGKER